MNKKELIKRIEFLEKKLSYSNREDYFRRIANHVLIDLKYSYFYESEYRSNYKKFEKFYFCGTEFMMNIIINLSEIPMNDLVVNMSYAEEYEYTKSTILDIIKTKQEYLKEQFLQEIECGLRDVRGFYKEKSLNKWKSEGIHKIYKTLEEYPKELLYCKQHPETIN